MYKLYWLTLEFALITDTFNLYLTLNTSAKNLTSSNVKLFVAIFKPDDTLPPSSCIHIAKANGVKNSDII
jgi:hypothetical protein